MHELRTSDPIPHPGSCFQIDTVHTSAETAPWFTGYWTSPDHPAPDPRVALRLWLAPGPFGRIGVLLSADDEHVYGRHHPLAGWNALPANAWSAAVAPTVATHPWAAHTHHGWEPREGGDKILRAALAYLLTH